MNEPMTSRNRAFATLLVGLTALSAAACAGSDDAALGGGPDTSHDELRQPTAARGRWLTLDPRQCGNNPWEGHAAGPPAASQLRGEAQAVADYFETQGVALEAVGFLAPPPSSAPVLSCAACQCARGDRLVVRAKDGTDAGKLVRMHGFRRADGLLLGRAAISCNMNPWDPDRSTRGAAADLGRWATDEGASLAYAGFVEPRSVGASCRACTCSRGDHAVVVATGDAEKQRLVGLGFEPLAD